MELPVAAESVAAKPAFDRLAAALAARGTEVLIVLREGALLYEWYAPGLRPLPAAQFRRSLASMSKGVIGGLGLARLAQDRLIGLDDPVGRYVPEWQDDPQRGALTLRQLATHSSGLSPAAFKHSERWARDYMENLPRRVELALLAPAIEPPGHFLTYSNPAFTIIGYAMSQAVWEGGRGDLRDHLRQELMRPLGIPDQAWDMGYGTAIQWRGVPVYDVAGGSRFTGRALALLGAVVTAGGKRGDGNPIMARHWLDELATPTMAALPPDWRELRQPTAGLGWWLNRNGAWPAAPPDTMVAAGSGHQLLLAIPSIGLTMVRLGDKLGADGFGGDYWQAFEAELLNPLLELLRTEHLTAELEPPPPAG